MAKPRIAVFSGPTATIQIAEPLVTRNKARSSARIRWSRTPPSCTARPTVTSTRRACSIASAGARATSPSTRSRCDRKTACIRFPNVARQADGQAWDGDGVAPQAPAERSRQPFYPDASRLLE
jgi:L-asparaginase